MTAAPLEVCLYSPADLNRMSGSTIWVQAVAEALLAGPRVRLTLPLRCPERRRIITDPLRQLDRVELVDPHRLRRYVPPSGLGTEEALDLVEHLDAEHHFDAILLRSFGLCLTAIRRPALRDRLWSCYVLEPERDQEDPEHVDQLASIAAASRYAVVQSEEMRALFEALVPTGRGKTIVLPPAIPPPSGERTGPAPFVRRLLYAGKFHPFYPVGQVIEMLTALRPRYPDLEFHVVGDQFFRPPGDDYAARLERDLATTPGVVWHGALTRAATMDLLARGGVAISLWDYRHGSTMNGLVVSMKLLDYCAAGLPVVATRTPAQETILGSDYPLFADDLEAAPALVARVLEDPVLYHAAAERCLAAGRRFAYPAVYAAVAPYLEGWADTIVRQFDRPKLEGAAWNVGLLLGPDATAIPTEALRLLIHLRRADPRFRLAVGRRAQAGVVIEPGADPAADLRPWSLAEMASALTTRTVDDPANWWRQMGQALILPDDHADGLREACASGAVPLALGGPPLPAPLRDFQYTEEAAAATAATRLAAGAAWPAASTAARRWALSDREP